jgi:hypothetical protein
VSDGESTTTGRVWHFTAGSDGLKVYVLSLNGRETLTIAGEVNLQWDALSERNVVGLDLFISRRGDRCIVDPIAIGVPNAGSYIWIVPGPSAPMWPSSKRSPTTARDTPRRTGAAPRANPAPAPRCTTCWDGRRTFWLTACSRPVGPPWSGIAAQLAAVYPLACPS